MSEFEKKLKAQLEQMPPSIEPEKDLWVGIEHALNRAEDARYAPHQGTNDNEQGAESQSRPSVSSPNGKVRKKPTLTLVKRGNPMLSMAAAVASVAVLGWFGFQQQAVTQAPTMASVVEQLEKQHIEQKQALLVSYQSSQPVTSDWQAQLSELDSAATAIKAALKEDPNNKALLHMLQQVYQQQLSLIETVYNPKWQAI